ncbi:MAG: metallophosphoesterase family protein [Treponema sp.]|nr:metallophosphoesterase family protein [Treponema sp.]
MKMVKKALFAAVSAACLLFTANAEDTPAAKSAPFTRQQVTAQPYNITVGVGSTVSEARFNWISGSLTAPVVQIAKTTLVKKNKFPRDTAFTGISVPVIATEGVQDNPENGETATGECACKVTVENLASNTVYSYRVGDGTTWSSIYTFKTGNDRDISFAVFGDPQMGASGDLEHDRAGWTKTLATVLKDHQNVNFLFSLGDQVNNYDSLAKQQSEYKTFMNPDQDHNYIQEHQLAVLEGNHDHQMGKYYSFHYNLPNVSDLGQTSNNKILNNDGDYWFTYGPVLFIILEGNNFYDTAAHEQALKDAIEANKNAQWKIVAFHQAPYSEANHSAANAPDDDVLFMRQNWTKLMDEYKVDVVLNGHDHYYTRTWQMLGGMPVDTTKTESVTNPKGTVYFTLDSGTGSKYYKYNTSADHSFSAVGWQNNVPTYSYVTVTKSQFKITTYETDSDAVIDTYSINKK